jgi:hypothetical protein
MSEPAVRFAVTVFAAARPFSLLWGIIVPGAIFAVSFAVTWALYRRFAGPRR